MAEKKHSERIKEEDAINALSSESPEISTNDELESKPIPTMIDDLDIQDIPGIGPTTAKKLRDAGILTVMDLAVA
ncbi:MAG TPA: helix-hairpin-helix domain-containing protein, partial [Nitrososphaeraceae archaeon]|nr:helix-hairpin-helix domain-containing protein [Nitrososphaeraceae archaeon]